MPSRLIYVGEADHDVCRLVQPSEIQRSMTLSHCWGQGPTLKLTVDALEEFMKQIPVNELPQTYLDAIMVTRHLGVEYLWIDSLCIVQDSIDDWQHECTQMSNVYKNSYCNIAALESIDSHGGLFSARDPSPLRPLIVKADWRGAPNTMWFTKLQLREKHYHEARRSRRLPLVPWNSEAAHNGAGDVLSVLWCERRSPVVCGFNLSLEPSPGPRVVWSGLRP